MALKKYLRFGILAVLIGWLALRLVPAPALTASAIGSKALFDKDGALLSLSLSADDKYRLFHSFKEISPSLVRATLLYEDAHFFSHPGVNPFSLLRGALLSVLNPNRPIGGSTITMQLARLRLGLRTRSISGKLQQILWALVLERHYTKEQILEAYLNLAPYGANVEGAGAASLVYFHKRARELSPEESVTLAVLPQDPASRWRASGRNKLEFARAGLLERWRKDSGETIYSPKNVIFSPAAVPGRAPHLFARLQGLRPELLELESTIDTSLQDDAEAALQSTLDRFSEFGVNNGTILLAELPDLTVRAYVGSAGYVNRSISGFVNGLTAPRSPGSVLKPFIYGLAIDQGQIIPETMLSDVPIQLASYRPENFERNFLGPISATAALVRSRNIPALELFRTLRPSSLYNFFVAGGIERLLPEEHYGIALVLGGFGANSEEIAQLYGLLGTGLLGTAGELRPLKFTNDPVKTATTPPLLTSETAFLVREMLSKNPPALGRFRELHIPWKTGTSFGSRDAWAAGLVGRYVLVVWLGNFDGRANPNLVGRDFAGPVFFSMVDRLVARGVLESMPLAPQINLKKVKVCALSGALAGPDCPHEKQSWFIPGVSPIKSCELHRRVQIHPESGLRLCAGESGGEGRVFELWDSGMQKLFERAGLRRNTPPPFEPRCGIADSSTAGIRIISPEEHVEYFLEAHRDLELPLLAAVPGDSRELSWFVDDVLIGTTATSAPLHWKAHAGSFAIRAVDDRGRSNVVKVRVLQQSESGI